MAEPAVVVVGGGLAGFQTAATLREFGFAGRVVLVCDEPVPPYHRPPLSKGFLLGESDESRIEMRRPDFYLEKNIDLVVGRSATAIDRQHRRIALDDGTSLEYGHLVLALGARNRVLAVDGANLQGVHYLRSLSEARALKTRLGEAGSAIVVGAGFIGLEFAMAARKLGLSVTVTDVTDRAMSRALTPEMAAVVAREHEKSGTRLMFDTNVVSVLDSNGRAAGVATAAGQTVEGDIVLVGIGVQPNFELASSCGLEVRHGIVVDRYLLTSDTNISAVGDCATHPNVFAGGAEIRLESVQNATDQARCVAARLCGRSSPYASVPWFWSDQGALKLQIAGITTGCDQVVMRGSPPAASCTHLCFRQGRLIGVETLNRAPDHMTARRLLAQHVALSPEQAADESVDLKQFLPQAA